MLLFSLSLSLSLSLTHTHTLSLSLSLFSFNVSGHGTYNFYFNPCKAMNINPTCTNSAKVNTVVRYLMQNLHNFSKNIFQHYYKVHACVCACVRACCLVALIFNTKLYRNLAVSQTVFFIPSQEFISRTDGWKAPKLGTIAHQYLVSKNLLGIFEIPSPSHFFTA